MLKWDLADALGGGGFEEVFQGHALDGDGEDDDGVGHDEEEVAAGVLGDC